MVHSSAGYSCSCCSGVTTPTPAVGGSSEWLSLPLPFFLPLGAAGTGSDIQRRIVFFPPAVSCNEATVAEDSAISIERLW